MQELKKAAQTHEGILIQGPSTVHIDRAFLRERVAASLEQTTLQSVYFFAREQTSYEVLKEILPRRVELRVDHDTALHLNAEDLPQAQATSAGHVFFAIRSDEERADVIDTPKPFRMWYDPVPVSQSFGDWVHHHAQARRIVTNRLHSAVLSSILGKLVIFLPNSYHKNRSVYEFSLADRGVEWQDQIESTALDRLLSVFPARIRRSYRLARGINSVRRTLAT
jgi:exopolysaccharide biosynthesis predicted pyruvyltransferase EpsI